MDNDENFKWLVRVACAIVLGWTLKRLKGLLKKTTFRKTAKEIVIRIQL